MHGDAFITIAKAFAQEQITPSCLQRYIFVIIAVSQGLNRKLEDKLKEKDVEIQYLKKRLARLEALLTANAH